MPIITAERARRLVARIERERHDYEMAHTLERGLRDEVLFAIAEGAPNARELAEIALSTGKINFRRCFA